MLIEGRDGKDYVVAGQKSGMVYALDPDNGDLIWSTRVGRGGVLGGIPWGMAADDAAVYVPVADVDLFLSKVEGEPNPSLAKLELSSGEILWQSPVDFDCEDIKKCYDGLSTAITLIDGAVLAPGLDGVLYAYDTDNGEVMWSYNSRRDYEGINGLSGNGGSLEAGGVIVADGLLMFNSGYGGLMMSGNVLLVFGRP